LAVAIAATKPVDMLATQNVSLHGHSVEHIMNIANFNPLGRRTTLLFWTLAQSYVDET
jgi:hypothetical protein